MLQTPIYQANHLEAFIAEYLPVIEEQLNALLAEPKMPYAALFKAARYSTLGGGKRIRPLLTLVTTHILQGNIEAAIQPACALEMIHTYSMIHDDLPAMDDDDFRRGKPSLHKAFSEGLAILTGDFLLTYAFEVIATAPALKAEQALKLISVLSKSSGGHGMIAGQVMDINETHQPLHLDDITLIHQTKTGALIAAAVEFGAIISQCSPQEQINLRQFGQEMGLAFQILDDVLDITSSKLKHGQEQSSDLKNQKSTFATLLGVEEAKRYAQNTLESALSKLDNLADNNHLLIALAKKICPQL